MERAAAAQREADLLHELAASLTPREGSRRSAPPTVRRCYAAEARAVPLARSAVLWLARRAGAGEAESESIRLCVSEAVTNAVIHAYPNTPGQVHLTAMVAGNELTVIVADDGVGVDAPPVRPGPGWGWPLIKDASDAFATTQRPGGGTQVQMQWLLSGGMCRTTADAGTARTRDGAGRDQTGRLMPPPQTSSSCVIAVPPPAPDPAPEDA